ncbi:phosphotransferase [Pelomonas sp. SE-A7]|uniref:aminoglycoside phosphotransferase family protein n=1 Tax=Pelomonas sp. SE-A7 TaxID=3054953 RepID=UPI00259C7487|nr:phosphotransferase [Pelomonas sp. SE-A7]MDM4766974.1 phosphotransferase [Pelomonas sp. SE-A7]
MSLPLWPDAAREQEFHAWLQSLPASLQLRADSVALATEDASTRRYLRLRDEAGQSYIVMDAPTPPNDVRPFLAVGAMMSGCGLHVPAIHAADKERGFLLLEDLGETTYLKALQQATMPEAERLMRAATTTLVHWQTRGDATQLPAFDEAFVRRELQIFTDWCVQRHHGRQWNEQQQAWWEQICALLARNIAEQPVVPMHRDYMPRNLMLLADGTPGVLDFQDAVAGPIGYDIASLLRDAFLSWDEEQELDWAIRYWELARKAGLFGEAHWADDFGEFWRRLEWTGLQRHLKILGIYCRLHYRDGKSAYIADLPRFYAYCIKVAMRYVELAPLKRLLEDLRPELTQTGFNLR